MPAGAIEAATPPPPFTPSTTFQCQLVRLRLLPPGLDPLRLPVFQCQLVRLRPPRVAASAERDGYFQCQLVRLRRIGGRSGLLGVLAFNASWCD